MSSHQSRRNILPVGKKAHKRKAPASSRRRSFWVWSLARGVSQGCRRFSVGTRPPLVNGVVFLPSVLVQDGFEVLVAQHALEEFLCMSDVRSELWNRWTMIRSVVQLNFFVDQIDVEDRDGRVAVFVRRFNAVHVQHVTATVRPFGDLTNEQGLQANRHISSGSVRKIDAIVSPDVHAPESNGDHLRRFFRFSSSRVRGVGRPIGGGVKHNVRSGSTEADFHTNDRLLGFGRCCFLCCCQV